jgi:hypothetical protein
LDLVDGRECPIVLQRTLKTVKDKLQNDWKLNFDVKFCFKGGEIGKSQFCRLVELKKLPPYHFGIVQNMCRLNMISKITATMFTNKNAATEF